MYREITDLTKTRYQRRIRAIKRDFGKDEALVAKKIADTRKLYFQSYGPKINEIFQEK